MSNFRFLTGYKIPECIFVFLVSIRLESYSTGRFFKVKKKPSYTSAHKIGQWVQRQTLDSLEVVRSERLDLAQMTHYKTGSSTGGLHPAGSKLLNMKLLLGYWLLKWKPNQNNDFCFRNRWINNWAWALEASYDQDHMDAKTVWTWTPPGQILGTSTNS